MACHCVLDPGKGVGEEIPIREGGQGSAEGHGLGSFLVISSHITAGRETYGQMSNSRHLNRMKSVGGRPATFGPAGVLPAEEADLAISSRVNWSYEADWGGFEEVGQVPLPLDPECSHQAVGR